MFGFKVTLGVYFVLVYKVTIFLCKQTKKMRFSIKVVEQFLSAKYL